MASTNSGVSYKQVYNRWLSIDHRRNKELTIPVNNILLKLKLREVVVETEYQMVKMLNHEITGEGKSMVKINAHFLLTYLNNRRLD